MLEEKKDESIERSLSTIASSLYRIANALDGSRGNESTFEKLQLGINSIRDELRMANQKDEDKQ